MAADRRRRARREDGYVIVTTALMLSSLCVIAALAVDIGFLLGARAAAQRAADAGALAGAFTFVSNSRAEQPATASAHAVATASANRVLDAPVLASEVAVNVDVAGRLVTVQVQHPVRTFFARVFGVDTVTVGGLAVAEASPTATGSACAKPWFMPNTVLSDQPACDACAAGEVFIAGGGVTAWARSRLGNPFTLKPNNPANSLSPGQFYAIAMPDSRGGADYRENIATCSPEQVRCGSGYQAEPGNMIGPTLQGVRQLIGSPADTWLRLGAYTRADGTVGDTSPSLITIPVWDACNMVGFCPAGELPEAGRNVTINVAGFAQVFVDGVQGNNVVGHLVGISACAAGGGGTGGGTAGPAPGEIGPYALPVRLVRTQ